jgi:hypothetical protein
MRLEQEFVRILLAKIKETQWDGGYHDVGVEDRPERVVSHYIRLLDKAGLIDAADFSTHEVACWRAKWITSEGERFLRAAEDERCWRMAQEMIRRSHRKLTLEALNQALPEARNAIRKQRKRG